nr:MAG TPA: hypothetical protein [Bacteriophage sp.]
MLSFQLYNPFQDDNYIMYVVNILYRHLEYS